MRNALATRDIVRVFRLLCHHGVPPGRIASFTGQSENEVGQILQGRTVQAYDTLVDIAEGLGVPLGYMGLAHDEALDDNKPCVCAELDEVTKRRRFLAHAALVTVGQAILGAVPRTWSGCGSQHCRAESTRHVLEEVRRRRAALLAELA
jgi:transcriptional regulator with XRE-family HTH domain